MDKRLLKSAMVKYLLVCALLLLVAGLALVMAHEKISSYEEYTLESTNQLTDITHDGERTAIVFGSAVDYIAGEPRPIVKARLDAAYELYENGHITSIIVSGHEDTVANDYNEPEVMADYLVYLGVSEQDVLEDNQGDSSFQTCKRAKHAFGVDAAVLVTQESHIQRVLYLCRNMGIDAYGITADAVSSDQGETLQWIREAFGNVKAVVDINLRYNNSDE